jgi:hypothetical protein
MLLLVLTLAAAEPLPPGYSCEDVRRMVEQFGKVTALAWAVEHGMTWRQIAAIKRECKL